MKKHFLAAAGAVMCLFGACQVKPAETKTTIWVTVCSETAEAEVWILPQTEETLKTTLWGMPTFGRMKTGEEKAAAVELSASGKYILRVIDTNHRYYAANDLTLNDRYTVRLGRDASLTVLDDKGGVAATRENIFEGALGAQ